MVAVMESRSDLIRRSSDEIAQRVYTLRRLSQSRTAERAKMRAIMNGGAGAVRALLGENSQLQSESFPAANFILKAGERIGQKIGRPPMLKVATREDRDSALELESAKLRRSIVGTYDELCKMEMQLPQVGRWLPGYGFAVWVIRERFDLEGNPYPRAELRDPFDCYTGWFGPDQEPPDLAVIRRVPQEVLKRKYPEVNLDRVANLPRINNGVLLNAAPVGRAGWESAAGEGELVAEYMDGTGTYIVLPTRGLVLDWIPPAIESETPFVVAKRFSFDQAVGHYEHVIGLQSAQAKLNILSVIAMEDAVFVETNVYGNLAQGQQYRRGRNAVNVFEQGSRVEKPQNNMPYQLLNEIDRLERQLRVGASYPVTDDAQSPVGFATGAAVDALASSVNLEIREYHTVLRHAIQLLDAKRLQWDEHLYGGMRKPLANMGRSYDPAKIEGRYQTQRMYGVMAGWDEPQKIVTGLQLLQGGIIDRRTMQENLDGIDDIAQIDERNLADSAQSMLMQALSQAVAEKDQRAIMTLIEMLPASPAKTALEKFYTPEGETPTPEEEMLLGQAGAEQFAGPQGSPDVTSILSRLQLGGQAEGGVQTVGTLTR